MPGQIKINGPGGLKKRSTMVSRINRIKKAFSEYLKAL
jgi:hypothetical protein